MTRHTQDGHCISAAAKAGNTSSKLHNEKHGSWSCPVCSVYHGDPCPDCGGRGFHNGQCGKASGMYLKPDDYGETP